MLARATLDDSRSVAALLVETVRYLGTGRAASSPDPASAPGPDDPPPLAKRPLWRGTSVTASGTVHGPGAAPYLRRIDLRAGSALRRFVAFGERFWDRRGEAASSPAPFDQMRLDVGHAYGGAYELPPGPDARWLPQPGGAGVVRVNPRAWASIPKWLGRQDSRCRGSSEWSIA